MKLFSIGIVCGAILLILLGVNMRKTLPYDIEIVPQDQSIAIVNTSAWSDRDCYVSINGDEINTKQILSGKTKFLSINGLKNNLPHKVAVGRTDIFGKIRYKEIHAVVTPRTIDKYIILLGASIGKSWNLRDLSQRKNLNNLFFGYRGEYDFDKSALVDQVLSSPQKPDIVIIKECAAYFPRETKESIEQLNNWAEQLLAANIKPVFATTVPVTKKHATSIKQRMESINAYNEEIRKLGRRKGIAILDMQKILAAPSATQYLDSRFATEDGLHLKKITYEDTLDQFIVDFIAESF